MTEHTGPTLISFLPKHLEFTDEEHDAAIVKYREWLDQHGRYGNLYMMNIERRGLLGLPGSDPSITGIKIYDYGIAVLFKLMFEI